MPSISSGSVFLPTISLSQSTVMIGALLAGFVLWLILNNKLIAYWNLLLGGAATTAPAAPANPPGSVAVPIPPAAG